MAALAERAHVARTERTRRQQRQPRHAAQARCSMTSHRCPCAAPPRDTDGPSARNAYIPHRLYQVAIIYAGGSSRHVALQYTYAYGKASL